MSSRQVQNVPPPRWVRPRSARWNACECAFAKPGSVSPRKHDRAVGPAVRPDGGDPFPLHVDEHARLGPVAAEPGVLRPIARQAPPSRIGMRTPWSAATSSARS